jgi:hypothetical protein
MCFPCYHKETELRCLRRAKKTLKTSREFFFALTSENVEVVRHMILEDRNFEHVIRTRFSYQYRMGMRKISAKLIPKCLNADQ